METMNLNDTNEGMVPLYPPPQTPPKAPEKNIPKQQTKMDSTPIADIMQDPPGMMMMDSQDPRAQFMSQNLMPQAPMVSAGMTQQKPQETSSKNPFNLTDEQMRALVAGVAAVIAFSTPVQNKLSTTIPNFLSEAGGRTSTGLIATGLIAALVFYFAQRFFNK
jgi:hypothetical protein